MPQVPPQRRVPPLEPGDHLTRAEFERRYDVTPNLKKAELLEGVVYMPPPVSQESHSGPHFDLILWLGLYRLGTPGVLGGDNGSLRLDTDDEPQPDGFLYIVPGRGGQARISEDGYVEGAPELVAEVAASSASYDLHVKKRVYLRNGVREYVVWRVLDQAVDWFELREGEYVQVAPGPDGIIRSNVLPGLWLDPAALIRGDVGTVSKVLQSGLSSARHAEFAGRIAPGPQL